MLTELFNWFTHLENTKPFALVLYCVTFIGIVIYIYANKKRNHRLESYKNIPFEEKD